MKRFSIVLVILLAPTLVLGVASCGKSDTTAPLIADVSVSNTTETGATVTWTTSEPSDSQVEYGLNTSYGSTTSTSMKELVTNHSVSLGELEPGTTYHYRVSSTDASGNEAVSDDHTFTTASLQLEERPEFKNPQKVEILGYDDDAMEPFISRDGQYLFFNNLNDPATNTNLYFAEKVGDGVFQFMGEVGGVNTEYLDAVPTMDNENNFYFVSVRSYFADYLSIYSGVFVDGIVSNVEAVSGNISTKMPAWINMDAEISPDGEILYFVNSHFCEPGQPPCATNMWIANKIDGEFMVADNSEYILQNINTSQNLEYAASISSDGLELFFTRANIGPSGSTVGIYRAIRNSSSEPFGEPETIHAVEGFAEAPSIAGDGKTLYYHKREGSKFSIYMVSRDIAP